MISRLAGRRPFTVMVAVMLSLLSVVDVATKAVFDRLARVREAKLGGLSLLGAWRVSGMPAIAGGSDGDIATQVADAVKATVGPLLDEKLKPITGRLEAIETTQKKLDDEVVRFDATGKRFKWAGGEAPAHVRSTGGDSRPRMLTNIIKAFADPNAATRDGAREELAFSDKLKAAGYQTHYEGGILVPLWPEAIQDEPLRTEAKAAFALGEIDLGQLGWIAKRYPDVAKAFGLTQKDMQLGDDSLGGILVPSVMSDRLIDLLRNRSVIARAGAQEIPLPPSGNITYPRLLEDVVASWGDPDTTSDASTSQPKLGPVRLIAKRLHTFVTVPNDLMRYAMLPIELLVRSMIASASAVKEDQTFLEHPGSTLVPKGLLAYPLSVAETPTLGKITLHVASSSGGDVLQPEDIRLIQGLYEAGNDPDPASAWILRPLAWAGITNERADAVSAGDKKGPFMFLSEADLRQMGGKTLQGVPVLTTMQASHNRGGSDLDYLLYGNFRRVIIGRSGVLELAASEHVRFLQDKTVVRGVLRSDMGLEHEESFVLTDALEGYLP